MLVIDRLSCIDISNYDEYKRFMSDEGLNHLLNLSKPTNVELFSTQRLKL